MKVIPYQLVRLKLLLKQMKESIDHAKDFQEKYWEFMTKNEKYSLIYAMKENITTLEKVSEALDRISSNGKS